MAAEEIHSRKRALGQLHHRGKDDGEDGGEGNGNGLGSARGKGKVRPWSHSSSRIVRVSRASGGKDRHSKVLTAKGLRDRRVRLSVSTAIQFYDLQDRLGYDQPSKAVDWLIKAAEAAITELPSLDSSSFPEFEVEAEPDYNGGNNGNKPCSSTSETSKGSGSVLSLSRSEIRGKARERARERAAKEKDRDEVHMGANLSSQSSFTELLAGGQLDHRKPPTADYLTQGGIFGQVEKAQSHFGNNSSPSAVGVMPLSIGSGEHLQHLSFLQDHIIPMAAVGEYGINFSISSGLAGLNRGTLQSNSPSSHFPLHHHHHHIVDGSSLPFFFGVPASAAAGENQFSNGFNGRYGDGYNHSELKGKEKG